MSKKLDEIVVISDSEDDVNEVITISDSEDDLLSNEKVIRKRKNKKRYYYKVEFKPCLYLDHVSGSDESESDDIELVNNFKKHKISNDETTPNSEERNRVFVDEASKKSNDDKTSELKKEDHIIIGDDIVVCPIIINENDLGVTNQIVFFENDITCNVIVENENQTCVNNNTIEIVNILNDEIKKQTTASNDENNTSLEVNLNQTINEENNIGNQSTNKINTDNETVMGCQEKTTDRDKQSNSDEFRDKLSSLLEILNKPLENEQINETIKSEQINETIKNEQINETIKNEQINETINRTIKNEQINKTIKNEQINEAIGNEQINETIKNEQINEAIGNEQINKTIKNEQVNDSLGDAENDPFNDMMNELENKEFLKVLNEIEATCDLKNLKMYEHLKPAKDVKWYRKELQKIIAMNVKHINESERVLKPFVHYRYKDVVYKTVWIIGTLMGRASKNNKNEVTFSVYDGYDGITCLYTKNDIEKHAFMRQMITTLNDYKTKVNVERRCNDFMNATVAIVDNLNDRVSSLMLDQKQIRSGKYVSLIGNVSEYFENKVIYIKNIQRLNNENYESILQSYNMVRSARIVCS